MSCDGEYHRHIMCGFVCRTSKTGLERISKRGITGIVSWKISQWVWVFPLISGSVGKKSIMHGHGERCSVLAVELSHLFEIREWEKLKVASNHPWLQICCGLKILYLWWRWNASIIPNVVILHKHPRLNLVGLPAENSIILNRWSCSPSNCKVLLSEKIRPNFIWYLFHFFDYHRSTLA